MKRTVPRGGMITRVYCKYSKLKKEKSFSSEWPKLMIFQLPNYDSLGLNMNWNYSLFHDRICSRKRYEDTVVNSNNKRKSNVIYDSSVKSP